MKALRELNHRGHIVLPVSLKRGNTTPRRLLEIMEMMDDREQAVFEALPDKIKIYRGCGLHNRLGASWSIDKSVAE